MEQTKGLFGMDFECGISDTIQNPCWKFLGAWMNSICGRLRF